MKALTTHQGALYAAMNRKLYRRDEARGEWIEAGAFGAYDVLSLASADP